MFKVACVVKIKLFFYGLILVYFDNTQNEARQNFQFFWQNTWFLGNNRGLA